MQSKKSRRPKKRDKWVKTIVKHKIEVNPFVIARKIKENNPAIFGECSVRTVNQHIAELEYTSHHPIKKLLLTLKQRQNRVIFAKKYRTWVEGTWLSVSWSNESTFTVTDNRSGNMYQWPGCDPPDPRHIKVAVKYVDSLMVWGAFTGHGIAELHVLPKNQTVNQYTYLELLCDHLPDSFEDTQSAIFQLDGALAYKAKLVCEWLDD